MTLKVNGDAGGSGGSSLPTATGTNQIPASTGAGTTYTAQDLATVLAASASANRAALVGPFADGMTGDGWSAGSGSGSHTETWGGGKLALVLSTGSAASGQVTRSDFAPSPIARVSAIRVQIVTGNGGTQRQVYLATGKDASNNVAVALIGDGSVVASSTVGGVYTAHATASTVVSSGDRTGGQLWLAILRDPGSISYAWGVGTGGALPTAWNVVVSVATATVTSADSGLVGWIGAITDASIAWAVDVLAIYTGRQGAF